MVIPEGLEPPTPCLEGRCSILLSYGTKLDPLTSIMISGTAGCRMLRGAVEVKSEGVPDEPAIPGKGSFQNGFAT